MGCPNYDDKEWCPPRISAFPGKIDTSNYETFEGYNAEMFLLRLKKGMRPTMWLFVKRFNLKGFADNLQAKNPGLSDAQARIPYLWHGKIYKEIYTVAEKFRWTVDKPTILLKRPEANGVNLFATCRVNGGPQLKKNPRDIVYLMAMVCEM